MNIYEYMSIGENEKPLDRIVTDGGFCAIFRTIACIGDSLASGEFESLNEDGTRHYHDFYEYSWGQFIGRSCGSKVYNFSQGGMTAKTYMEVFADNKGFWDKDKLAQAYIIALGVNDVTKHLKGEFELGSMQDIDTSDYRNNAKTFIGYYAQIIQRIKELQPRAKIFLVSPPQNGKSEDIRTQKYKEVRDLLQGLTTVFNRTYLLDMFEYAPKQDKAFSETFWLGHMTPTGYVLGARMIESYIDYIIRKNPKDFAQVGFIGTDFYYKPEEE